MPTPSSRRSRGASAAVIRRASDSRLCALGAGRASGADERGGCANESLDHSLTIVAFVILTVFLGVSPLTADVFLMASTTFMLASSCTLPNTQ